jgi:hypothetical protein
MLQEHATGAAVVFAGECSELVCLKQSCSPEAEMARALAQRDQSNNDTHNRGRALNSEMRRAALMRSPPDLVASAHQVWGITWKAILIETSARRGLRICG